MTHREQVQKMYELAYELADTAEAYKRTIETALAEQMTKVQGEVPRQKLTSLVNEWMMPEVDRFIRLMQDDAVTLLHRVWETDSLLDQSNLFTEVML